MARKDSAAICTAAAHPSLRSCSRARSAAAISTPKLASRSPVSGRDRERSSSRSSHSSPASRSRCSRTGGSLRPASTSWAVSTGQRSTRSVMSADTAVAAAWKSSTMIAMPSGSFEASFASDAVTSADMALSRASTSAASAPNPGASAWSASMKPDQKRTGSVSALSQDSQEVTPGRLVAAQFDSSTLLPDPAEPTTTVRRLPAPEVSWSCSRDLVTSVLGSVVGRNFVSAKPHGPVSCRAVPWDPLPRHLPSALPRFRAVGREAGRLPQVSLHLLAPVCLACRDPTSPAASLK